MPIGFAFPIKALLELSGGRVIFLENTNMKKVSLIKVFSSFTQTQTQSSRSKELQGIKVLNTFLLRRGLCGESFLRPFLGYFDSVLTNSKLISTLQTVFQLLTFTTFLRALLQKFIILTYQQKQEMKETITEICYIHNRILSYTS